MRLRPFSSDAPRKLANERVTPVKLSDATVKPTSSPNHVLSTAAAAALVVEWPLGYSGCAGVGRYGVHAASRVVPVLRWALPSSLRIAWYGRQKSNSYLASQAAMRESA